VKLRTGTIVAFAIGYVLGARAGRERYEQLARAAGLVGRSRPVSGTTNLVADKAKAAATIGVERLKDTIGVRLGWRDGDEAADAIRLDLAEDLALAINNRRHLPTRPANRWTDPAKSVPANAANAVAANGSAQASSR
jgi:hypothetical protein